MVIFHSYVKLPEGKMNRKNIQDVSQILKMSEVALCWAPPMAQRLRSARNFCTPRRWWKTCRRRWLLWFKSWSFQNTSMYVQCIFKSFQCMFRIFQCMFRIFQCIFRSCFTREHVVPMVTYGESRADGGRIVLTHVVFPLTGVLPISLPMTRCKCWKSYERELQSEKVVQLRCYRCVRDGFLTTAPAHETQRHLWVWFLDEKWIAWKILVSHGAFHLLPLRP